MDTGGGGGDERRRCLWNVWRGGGPLIIDSFASEGFSIAGYNFAKLGTRLSPSPSFNAVGDFSIGAWGFVSETMEFVVRQCVYVATRELGVYRQKLYRVLL